MASMRLALRRIAAIAALLIVSWSASPSAAVAANGDCGIPLTSGSAPKSSDCLFILKVAVGSESCRLCTCDLNDSGGIVAGDALQCLKKAVGQNVTLACPDCPAGGSCPARVAWATLGSFGAACAKNADCAAGSCSGGVCRTSTGLELGWSGHAHGNDLGDGFVLTASVHCSGDGGDCGACTVDGIDPSAGNCRCANDNRRSCDAPFTLDAGCPACFAGAFVGNACASNADCQGGPCSRRCQNDLAVTCTKNADCPGSTCVATTKCSTGRNCVVEADCTGSCTTTSLCQCYDGAPFPVSAGGTPFCMLPRFSTDLGGTVDPDSGASLLHKDLTLTVYSGLSTISPCPVCGGVCSNDTNTRCSSTADCSGASCQLDAAAGDGVRGGVCIGGANDKASCDVAVANADFPAVTEGARAGYSLDCFPGSGSNVSGAGLRLRLDETTGSAVLNANLECLGAPELSCPCALCSGDRSIPCRSDADCASQSGTCSAAPTLDCVSDIDCSSASVGPCNTSTDRCSKASSVTCSNNGDCIGVAAGTCEPSTCSGGFGGVDPQPNDCDGGLCSESGSCTDGPDLLFCDNVLRADGHGILPCATNADCSTSSAPVPEDGTCSQSDRLACFPDSIVATGSADPEHPLSVATFCSGATSTTGRNSALGLPGPARLQRQTTMQSFCPGSAKTYLPHTGGCD